MANGQVRQDDGKGNTFDQSKTLSDVLATIEHNDRQMTTMLMAAEREVSARLRNLPPHLESRRSELVALRDAVACSCLRATEGYRAACKTLWALDAATRAEELSEV